ncbi:hypothetical protein [Legionella cincinnatiensis]|uniref:hypothetical protein n=1 Tax=Legionella cincinnatiensis TaxID=28085 RepID=UPI000730FFA4|nr:hypothetical protein [Legionella cincinnatiensis]
MQPGFIKGGKDYQAFVITKMLFYVVQVHKEEQKPQGQLQMSQNSGRYVFFYAGIKSGEILVASNQATRAAAQLIFIILIYGMAVYKLVD